MLGMKFTQKSYAIPNFLLVYNKLTVVWNDVDGLPGNHA